MYADDESYLGSQNNAKSSLQALLKARELQSSSEISDQKGKDFNYSQKLFHIADGNLYSIFSPIQGRSYGMKPSFLRKQKYTVQESRSRGHKSLRKGLKFHNFLPSESVTSEKDDGYQRKWKVHSECRLQEEHGTKQITISNWSQSTQNAPIDQHSIISKNEVLNNSSYSGNCSFTPNRHNDSEDNSLSSNRYLNASVKCEGSRINDIIGDRETGNSYEKGCSSISGCDRTFPRNLHDALTEVKKRSECSVSRKSILDNVLSSLRDSPSSYISNSCDETETNLKNELDNQKHRRKPTCTRRIVPYSKYLSLMEETETVPLDLSSKFVLENLTSPGCTLESNRPKTNSSENCVGKNTQNNFTDFEKITYSSKATINNKQVSSLNVDQNISSNSINVKNETLINSFQNNGNPALTFLYPLPVDQSVSNKHSVWHQLESKDNLSMSCEAKEQINSFNPTQEVASSSSLKSQLNNVQYTFQKPFIKESRTKPRRRSQRSVIKQKLEDTFKQNGFLVKTKQVSDGEATFCKFRQLRKYTRYYLKSWQQHLPDEVHKMWKGFLPPKTVIPPIPSLTENARDPS